MITDLYRQLSAFFYKLKSNYWRSEIIAHSCKIRWWITDFDGQRATSFPTLRSTRAGLQKSQMPAWNLLLLVPDSFRTGSQLYHPISWRMNFYEIHCYASHLFNQRFRVMQGLKIHWASKPRLTDCRLIKKQLLPQKSPGINSPTRLRITI